MGYQFNPLIFSGFDLTGGGAPPPILPPVPSTGDLPPSAPDGYIIVTTDDQRVWVYSAADSRWVDTGLSESEVFGTTPTADGYDIVLDDSVPNIRTRELVLQPADATNPGAVSTVAQDFGGVKTFVDGLDAGGNVISNVADPVAQQDAATKEYVDDADALKANITLNNLSSTAVNASILPATDITIDLGSPTKRWSSILGMNLGIDGLYNSTAGGPGGEIDFYAATLDMQGNAITNLVNPTNPQDAATKDYVDNADSLKANVELDNLSNTAVNDHIIPAVDDDVNLGSETNRWSDGWFANKVKSYGVILTDPGHALGLRFYETDETSNFIGVRGPTTVPTTTVFTLPDADGTSGDVLSTDGAGQLQFITPTPPPTGDPNTAAFFDAAGDLTFSPDYKYTESINSLQFGEIDTGGTITSTGVGSFAHGTTVNSGSSIDATGSGAHAQGYATDDGAHIVSSGLGSFAGGYKGAVAAIDASIEASGDGSLAHGYAGFNSVIGATGRGSVALGGLDGTDSVVSSSGVGSVAIGASGFGYMFSSGRASFVHGVPEGADQNATPAILTASGNASTIIGTTASAGRNALASGAGSIILGSVFDQSGGGNTASSTTPTISARAGLMHVFNLSPSNPMNITGNGGTMFGAVPNDAVATSNTVSGMGAFIGGYFNSAIAQISSGLGAFIWGTGNTNSGQNAAAFGLGHIQTANQGFVLGRYSDTDTDSLFAVGNGASAGSPNNALEIKNDGTQFIKDPSLAGASVGYVRTLVDASTGETEWQAGGGGGGANTALSNLIATAINQNLIFDTGGQAYLATKDDATVDTESLVVRSGDATGFNSGSLNLLSGDGVDTGGVFLRSGTASGDSGGISIATGNAGLSASGQVLINTGDGSAPNVASGALTGRSGAVTGTGFSGEVTFLSGTAVDGNTGGVRLESGAVSGTIPGSGGVSLLTGATVDGPTGGINIDTGVPTGNGVSGDIYISTGTTSGTGKSGDAVIRTGQATGGDSGNATFVSGPVSTGNTGAVSVLSGDVGTSGNSGAVSLLSGYGDTSGNVTVASGISGVTASGAVDIATGFTISPSSTTGQVTVRSGNHTNTQGGTPTGNVSVTSGNTNGASPDSSSGAVTIASGNSTNGNSGPVTLQTGTAGVARGKILLVDGSEGTIGHVWTSTSVTGEGEWAPAAGGGATWAKQVFTLNGTDITNQYVTLSNTPLANSVQFVVRGGGIQMEGASYEYSVTGAQVNFLNDLATGGGSALIAGDIICIQYQF